MRLRPCPLRTKSIFTWQTDVHASLLSSEPSIIRLLQTWVPQLLAAPCYNCMLAQCTDAWRISEERMPPVTQMSSMRTSRNLKGKDATQARSAPLLNVLWLARSCPRTCDLSSAAFEANFEHVQELSVICLNHTPRKGAPCASRIVLTPCSDGGLSSATFGCAFAVHPAKLQSCAEPS
jgi:hypothetical protein